MRNDRTPRRPAPVRRWIRRGRFREASEWTQVALMFPSSIAVGVAIGYGLDRWWGTAPWMTLIMTLFGILSGFYHFYRSYQRWFGKKSDRPEKHV